jgi:hypothetical protein
MKPKARSRQLPTPVKATAAPPPRLRRADSFLGIHFDFHAGADCTEVGKDVSAAMIERVIDRVHPDYVQCDCKGHAGYSSYPTQVGTPAPGFVRDPLRIWRDVTAARGVALYMHYSGVWDNAAIAAHPSWARVNEKGKRDKHNTSVFGSYVDERLIPQLIELRDCYEVDGVWIDGDCWATERDYGKAAVAAWQAAGGALPLPHGAADAGYAEFSEFCREGFRNYVRRYINALHRHDRGYQIASNWAFSSFMPEPVTIDVDFISGDYSFCDALRSARLEGRYMAAQGLPWDLMAWSFYHDAKGGSTTKTVVQLQQEAAVVLALGGGFQAYFTQRRDGSINEWQMELMGQVAQFCRARQSACHRAQAVPQIGLLLSTTAFYGGTKRLFRADTHEMDGLNGMLHALLDSRNSVEVLSEHHLTPQRLGEYPLIVVPEWPTLDAAFIARLKAYVRDGGNLLLVGPRAAALFEKELGVNLQGEPGEQSRWLQHEGWLAGMRTSMQSVRPGKKARPFGRLFKSNAPVGEHETAATIADYGKGRIAATYLNFGERFLNGYSTVARDFVEALVRELYPQPTVRVTGSRTVDVCLNRVAGKLSVSLVNTAGPHQQWSRHSIDEIAPTGPLQIELRLDKKPRRVTVTPGGEELPFAWSQKTACCTLPRLDLHVALTVE